MILWTCTASMPRAIPASKRTYAAAAWNLLLSSASSSVPALAYAITTIGVGSKHAPNMRTTLGWRTRANARTSRRMA